jgi:hypothetical protein
MIDPNCNVCFGIGWVYETIPTCVGEKTVGCQCGAGMPCECVCAEADGFGLMCIHYDQPEGALPRRERYQGLGEQK